MNQRADTRFGFIRNNIIYIVLICLLPLPYLFSDTVILNYMDMYQYLDVVEDFQNDNQSFFFTPRRTNLFPLILWLNLKIFGNALLAIKFLYVFVIMLLLLECLILGRLLFKNDSGIVTAILICTSYTFAHFLYFPHIDLLLLVMLLACLIVMFIALEHKPDSPLWMAFSGSLIGLSFLLKEAAIWLLFFVPVYSLLKHVKFKQLMKQWCIQLLPLLLIAAPIIYYHHDGFYGRYIDYPMNWFALMFSGDTVVLSHNAGGVFQQKASFLNMFTFLLAPIFWQWEPILPIPKNLIILEQVIIVSTGLYYFIRKTTLPHSKLFLLTVLIVFLPRYIVFSVNAYKIRQVLIFFFVLYPILGNSLYRVLIKCKSSLLPYTELRRIQTATVLLVFTFYALRIMFCIDGMTFTLNSAEFNYQRRQIIPLHSETK